MKPPLSDRLRPSSFSQLFGQEHLTGESGFITTTLKQPTPLSLVLWGPPGCGKTTLAHLYAQQFSARFIPMSAVFSGVADIKKIIKETEESLLLHQHTIVFVDEIHRFNKAQQDAFLPYLERGTIILVGATTENPSFSLNNALLSRLRVITLNPLSDDALEQIMQSYETTYSPLPITPEARQYCITIAQGDGRYLINMIENITHCLPSPPSPLTIDDITPVLQRRNALYDANGDGHYNLISALHKSIRGSDPDAALYWFSRMLEGGEDPLFIARRLIRMATEDIGLADPQALTLAIAARNAYQMLGSPEGELALAETTIYLALAPKSNATYTAYKNARKHASETNHLPPPKTILNAPTKLMKNLDYGKNYQYDHNTPSGCSGQYYFPDDLQRRHYYHPKEVGFERDMKKRLNYYNSFRSAL